MTRVTTIAAIEKERAQQAPMSTTEELEKQVREARNKTNSLSEIFYLSMMAFWLFVITGLMISVFLNNLIPIGVGVATAVGLVIVIKKYYR